MNPFNNMYNYNPQPMNMNMMMNCQNMNNMNNFQNMNMMNNNMGNNMMGMCNNNMVGMCNNNMMGMCNNNMMGMGNNNMMGMGNNNMMGMGNNNMMGMGNNNMMGGNNMNKMFMMFQNWLKGTVINNINNNNNNNNMNNNFFQQNNMNNNNFNNNNNNNNTNTGDQAPKGILERGEKYLNFKVDDCDIRNIKFSASSGLNVMISINKNKPLKELFKEYAKRVGFPEFHLGKEIIFLFNALTIDVNDNNTINSLFPKDLITITVIDQKEIIGANN